MFGRVNWDAKRQVHEAAAKFARMLYLYGDSGFSTGDLLAANLDAISGVLQVNHQAIRRMRRKT